MLKIDIYKDDTLIIESYNSSVQIGALEFRECGRFEK